MRNPVTSAIMPPAAVMGGVVLLLGGLGTFAQIILSASVMPGPLLLGQLALCAFACALPLCLPIASLLGVLSGLRRLQLEGAWLGLRGLGYSGLQAAGATLPLLLPLCLLSLGMGHLGEPLARAALRDARVAAAAQWVPIPGQTLHLGPWATALDGGRLHFAGQGIVGAAPEWELIPHLSGIEVILSHGELHAIDGSYAARFQRLTLPVNLPGSQGKVQVIERGSPELYLHLTSHKTDLYEWWLLYKRSLLPICTLIQGLAAVPWGLGKRPVPAVAGAMMVSNWVLVRILDQNIRSLDLLPASILLLTCNLLWLLGGWLRWPDR